MTDLNIELEHTTVSRDQIETRADLVIAALHRAQIPPDFPTALGLLGIAVLQLRELGVVDSNVREAVEYWLAQQQSASTKILKPKRDRAHAKRIMANWLRD